MAPKALVVACALFLGMCIITSGKPAPEIPHAFCKIVWLLGLQCEQANIAIVSQIKAMGSYKLSGASSVLVKANHTSAIGQFETVNFTMIDTAMGLGCHVEGTSVSQIWQSLFDNGTNYCNLRNVVSENLERGDGKRYCYDCGSGLTKAPGFVEFTNEWLCLGYGLSGCK